MKKKINRYNFDRISSRMSQKFGTIKKGDEEDHALLLFPMESNISSLSWISNTKFSMIFMEIYLM